MQACTITACSTPPTTGRARVLFDFYQPGNPSVTSLSACGRAARPGAREWSSTAHNLSDAVRVTFGTAVAEAASAPEILTNGSSTEVDAVAPPGKAGSTVKVRVKTVESQVTHTGRARRARGRRSPTRSSVASAPRHVTATVHGDIADRAVGRAGVQRRSPRSPITGCARARCHGRRRRPRRRSRCRPGMDQPARRGSPVCVAGLTYRITVWAITSQGLGLPGTSSAALPDPRDGLTAVGPAVTAP